MKLLILLIISLKLINCFNKTINDDYYDEDNEDEHNKYDYDDEKHLNEDEPYKCPKLCNCEFINKNKSTSSKDYDDYDHNYEINVNCANRSLNSLNSLFDDEFPIESIVNL
jgi:hypothetical protein